MHISFSDCFVDPIDKAVLVLHIFKQSAENIIDGLYINPTNHNSYPIIHGVPVFIRYAVPKEFSIKYSNEFTMIIAKYPALNFQHLIAETWSFSLEWESHDQDQLNTTWGWTLEKRFSDFIIECEIRDLNFENKILLDAGCGNGQLTEYFSKQGLRSIGIDYSDSVFQAESNRNCPTVCFIKGDLQHLPFKDDFFDIVVSNGVLHHTPHTETTFYEVAHKVKQSGTLYIWLYSRKGSLLWALKRRIFDFLRIIVCRLSPNIQKLCVEVISQAIYIFNKKVDFPSLRVAIFDSITPRWRYYHTPEDVSYWFYKAGFLPITLSHWKNRFGFGVKSIKTKQNILAGE